MSNVYYLHSDEEIPKETLLRVREVLGSGRVYADVQGKDFGYYFMEEKHGEVIRRLKREVQK